MTGSFPDLRIHDNRRIQTENIIPRLHKFTPPEIFYVVLEFHTMRPVIPESAEPAVYFTGRKDKSPSFGQTDNLIHVYHLKLRPIFVKRVKLLICFSITSSSIIFSLFPSRCVSRGRKPNLFKRSRQKISAVFSGSDSGLFSNLKENKSRLNISGYGSFSGSNLSQTSESL